MAVAEVELLRRGFDDLPLPGQIPHRGQHILHLAAVGTGVHVDRTAHRAGDAVGKLESGEAGFQRRHTEGREHLTGPHDDRIVSKGRVFPRETDIFDNADAALHGRHVNDSPAVACILEQDVAAVAQQIALDPCFFCQPDGGAELLLVFRQDEQVCRAADAEGAVGTERLILLVCNARSGQSLF